MSVLGVHQGLSVGTRLSSNGLLQLPKLSQSGAIQFLVEDHVGTSVVFLGHPDAQDFFSTLLAQQNPKASTESNCEGLAPIYEWEKYQKTLKLSFPTLCKVGVQGG